MKQKGWKMILGVMLMAFAIIPGYGHMETLARTVTQNFVLKDYTYTKSSDVLKVEKGKGNDDYMYIGDDKQSSSVGQSISYEVDIAEPGEYLVKVVTKKHSKKGVFQFLFNDKEIGAPFDQYSTKDGNVTVELGKVQVERAGKHTVSFQILEKNPASPVYQITVKELIFVKEVDDEIPEVDFGEDKYSESGNVVSYPLPYIYKQSTDFTVKADGLEIPVVSYRNEYDYAHFSMNGKEDSGQPVTIEINFKENITNQEISPKKLGLEGNVNGKSMTFTLDEANYLIIRLNNGKRLVITADKMEQDVPESSGDGVFNVLEAPYNAERTGTKSSTKAIQQAIDDASAYGTKCGDGTRGVVYIPKGVYQTASLVLKSNVEVYLEGGAVLRASLKKNDYVVRGRKNSIGKDVIHLIYTENNKLSDPYDADYQNPDNFIESVNMKIYGRGTVDARGRELEKEASLLSQSLIPVNCSGFTADGIILRDTGVWSVAPGLSDDLEFTNLKILNTMNHEDDCIDINGCQDVVVKNVIGIALDDPFSTKTWEVGELFQAWCGTSEPNKNILFEDCLSWSYCYGFKVGQGSWYDQSNIVFRNGTVYDCAVGLGVHHKYGTASLSDILFENIDIEHVTNSNDGHRTWLHMQAITGGKEGSLPIQDVTIRNINVYDKGTSTAKLVGYNDEYGIQGIQMDEIYMEHLKKNAETLEELDIKEQYIYCKDLTLDGKKLADAPKIVIEQLENFVQDAELSENCPNLATGEGYVYVGQAVGDWASFPIVAEAGTYKVEIMMKQHDKKGIFQLSVNDSLTGEPIDQYYKGNKKGVIVDLGTVTFEETGAQKFKFEIVGKNEASGGYQLVLDAVKLTRLNVEPELEKIEVTKLPEKTKYFTGDKADFTGLEITAYYSDGTIEVLLPEKYEISGFDSDLVGTVRISILYEDMETSFEIEVEALPEDVEEALEHLKKQVASASNAEDIRQAADNSFDFIQRLEVLNNKIFDFISQLEKKLIRLDDKINASKILVDKEVTRLFGILSDQVSADGGALTAYYKRGGDTLASPSNAVMNLTLPDQLMDVPKEYDSETAVVFALRMNVVTGEDTEEDVELAAPVRIHLPMPKGMTQQDVINILTYDEEGNLLEVLLPEKTENTLSLMTKSTGVFLIARESSEEPEHPDDDNDNEGDNDNDEEYLPDDLYDDSDEEAVVQTIPGDWVKDDRGWRYRLTDENYPKQDWVIVNGIWYYFDENGYMQTGWISWKNKWYYLSQDGSCAVNTITPDGYRVDYNGAWVAH